MAMTQTRQGPQRTGEGSIWRYVETGSANTLLTASVPAVGGPFRVLLVTVKYSASPTQAGVTTTLNSGAGAAYDTVLNTGSSNAQTTVYHPSADLILGKDDALDVAAPAGGAGITAAVAVYVEKM